MPALKEHEIDIFHTALGQYELLKKMELSTTIGKMTMSKRSALVKQLEKLNAEEMITAADAANDQAENIVSWLCQHVSIALRTMEAKDLSLNVCLIVL